MSLSGLTPRVRSLASRVDKNKVRSAARTTLYSTVIAGAHVARRATPLVRRVSPTLADRMDNSDFLQQPTHGKRWHEKFYGSQEDPYGFSRSEYEAGKYQHTIDAIRSVHSDQFGRALEIGAAEGLFTRMLADIATDVLALEISEIAVQRAQEKLSDTENVTVALSGLPGTLPTGSFDLIVASDVLYYFPSDVLRRLLTRLEAALNPGGVFVTVNYQGNWGARVGGPAVHQACDETLTIPRVLDERRTGIGPDGVSGYRVSLYRKPTA